MPGQFFGRMNRVAVVHLDPETEPFSGIDLAEAMQGAAAGAVDHLFWAAGLRAKIAGLGQGAVPAHAAVKKDGLEQAFAKGEQTAGLFVTVSPETDGPSQGKKGASRLERAIVNLLVDAKGERWA